MNGTKDFALEQELSIEAESQKGNIVFPGSSMSILIKYTDAAAFNDDGDTELPRDQKTRSTQRTRRPRDLLGNNQEEWTLKNMWVWAREGSGTTGRSSGEVAPRTSPGR